MTHMHFWCILMVGLIGARAGMSWDFYFYFFSKIYRCLLLCYIDRWMQTVFLKLRARHQYKTERGRGEMDQKLVSLVCEIPETCKHAEPSPNCSAGTNFYTLLLPQTQRDQARISSITSSDLLRLNDQKPPSSLSVPNHTR